ncbi:hypothetical protein P8452_52291 [Trifolium repens]|nr:hypothetical protein P8452_52291 [Trifolium repens]
MEYIEQDNAILREEMDGMKEKMDQILEFMQAMANKESNPQPVVTETNTAWPPYGLPPNYTPPIEGGGPTQPPLVTLTIPVANGNPLLQEASTSQNENTPPHHTVEGTLPVCPLPDQITPAITQLEDGSAQKYKALEERLKAIEGFCAFGIDALDMCLVPDVVIPPKFKSPDFEKYKGLQCPKIHLKRLCTKMSAHVTNEKLMMHLFQDSLSGASLDWYMQLEKAQIQTWKDLIEAFLTQYKYNIGVAPTRMQLQGMTQKGGESFKEYAQKWREVAARVQPPLLEKELVDTFMSTLHGPYYEKMIGSISSNFADLVTIGERVEEGIKNGKIQGTSAQTGVKKFFGGPPKRKEGETNVVSDSASRRPPVQLPYPQYSYVAAMAQGQYQLPAYPTRPPQQPLVVPPQGQPQQNKYPPWNQSGPRGHFERKVVRFDPVPMPYSQILPYLLQKGMVELKPLPPVAPPYPPHFDNNARCEYHAGAPGHNIESCKAFKYKVQELLDRKLISFKEEGPNVKTNPQPGHASSSVNAVEEVEEMDLLKEASKIKTPLSVVRERLIGFELFERLHSGCKDCLRNPASCQGMKESLQKLIDQGLVQIGYSRKYASIAVVESLDPTPFEIPYQRVKVEIPLKKIDPMIFHIPAPFSFKSTKEVPWNYLPSVYVGEKSISTVEPIVDNIAGIGGMTRSGRIFSHDPPNKSTANELVGSTKRKAAEEFEMEVGQSKKMVPQEGAEEFLRIIRKTLLKILNEAHVTKDITVDQFDGVVANITTSRYLGFNESELPSEGQDHNKALHISVKCSDNILSEVLVDTGSSLNVMPKATLAKLACEGASLRPSSLIVKAFDGSRRAVMGEVDLPILIGPQIFNITFQIMDINPAYSCLLGRPWIHAAGAVTSTLHQKLKFITGDNMIVVSGQEDLMVSHLSSFRYIEADEEVIEVPFQALEIARVTTLKTKRKKGGLAMTLWKAMKEALEEGVPLGWGKVPEVCEKKDRFGLGYRPKTKGMLGAAQKKMGTLQEIFRSAGFNYEGHVAMMEDEEDKDVFNLVHQCAPDEVLRNWKGWEIPEVVFKSTNKPIKTNTVIVPIDFEFPINQAEEGDEDDCELPKGLARLLEQEEKEIQPHQEPIEVINLGTDEDKKEIKIGASLKEDVKRNLASLLQEYVDVFAWSYQDMPGLDTDIVVHRLPLRPECPPVKQKLRRTRPDMALKIREEVKKQFDAGFLAVAKYPQWVANIVPVPKKDGKVRMCVDYRDLNRASPKDDFPLPHIDVLVDNTAQYSVFSFMDGFSGYNQIKMAPEDMEKTTFITPWGTFCYKVMPFGLKNAGATYQRAMVTLFHDMIHKEIEVYVDDMIAKSQEEDEHLVHLSKLFARLRKFKLRLNPNKCTFGVRSGKLLGFIVSQKGIEVDPDKVKAIQNMPAPRTEKEVRGFLGRLNYIARFISHLTATCEPIFKLLRKDQAIEWNEDCQKAFDKIKEYLLEPPILTPPVPGRPLLIYLTVLEGSMGCVLGQHDETGRKEHAIYFLSKKFTECELRYTSLEKTCCALAWATRRLRQYMLTHTTMLISKMDPIKYIFEKPALTGKIARWQMLLFEYDIQYVTQKAIKGSVLSEHLAHQPLEEYQPIQFDFPDEDIMILNYKEPIGDDEGPEPGARWKLAFDGASNAMGHGIGAVLISPRNGYTPFTARLCFDCTNNIAE